MIYFTKSGRKARRKLTPDQTVRVIRLVGEARMFWAGDQDIVIGDLYSSEDYQLI